MGKAARWFRSLLGGGKKEQQQGKDQRRASAPATAVPPPADRKRWSFARSSRDSVDSAAAAGGNSAAIARAAEAAWLKSVYGGGGENGREQSKHAIAVAAATAAAADAAVAAAQAAVEVVRLTSQGPVFAGLEPRGRAGAAVKIQTAFRGFLAKKALRALKALVKLQALVRGYLVRKQAAATLQSMQALVRAQAAVRAARCRAAVPALPPLHHPPVVRPRFSLQERYVDDTRSEHGGVPAYSRRLSASIETSSYGGGGYDRSPKIVEMDTGSRCSVKSRASSSLRTSSPAPESFTGAGAGDEWWYAQTSVSSPLLPSCHLLLPPRIAVPTSRHFPDYDWCPPEKPRPATAQCTPRFTQPPLYAPATPTKSVCGGGGGNCAPGYMSSTQSSEAKSATRSQSAPKQRPESGAVCGARKRVPLSEVVLEARASLSGVGMQKSCNRVQEAFDFRKAVVSRFERSSDASAAEMRDRDLFLQRRW
ncbi:hypothetical protein EJB05_31063, partial [Eragrostis curvula]